MEAVGARTDVLEFRVLGPLEVWRGGRPVRLGGERQRELLALLLLNANEIVSAERLIEDLYGGDPSGTAANALQAAVSRLRRLLDDDAGESIVVTRAPGYLLRATPEQVDLTLFERLAEEGRAALARGDPVRAAVVLREALALWRGPPLADLLLLDVVRPEVRRLEELRLAAVLDRIDADLAAGAGGELVPEVEALVDAHPLQERLRGQLLLALYRAGRQADALAAYRETREFLRDELGLEPSRALQQLERAILTHDAALGPTTATLSLAATPTVVVCPFKGLAAFEIVDTEFFCGRERAVADVVSRLAASPLVGIVGPSGVGKSSILRAGLLQRLSVGVLPGSERWRVGLVRPGEHPVAALDGLLGTSAAAAVTQLRADERLVVVVDQLEEAFTLCDDEQEREEFFRELVDLTNDAARRALVVVCLRADFYGRCARYHGFAELLSRNHVLVRPMERDELARAIELPAGRAGLQVERALVDALVADVADEPGGLPLLATTLLELWRRRDGHVLRFDAYRDSGGVRGAVARLAEAAYGELGVEEQAAARTIFLRLALGEGDAVVRRRVPLAELEPERDAVVGRVLDRLVAARLLTVSDGTVEVAHEALLREWPRLRGWLDDDREGRRVHAHLAAAAREWDEHGRDRADLYRGARLSAALEWSAAHAREPNELERAFLAAGRHEGEREVRRLRSVLALLALLLVAAVVAGVLTLVSRTHARREATVALAQQLGAEAVSEPRIDRAMLLAREAVNLDDSPATQGTLLATLLRSPSAIGTFALPITDRPQNVRVSPDGRTIAVRTNTNLMRFYDTRTHRQLGAVPALGADYTYLPGSSVLFVLGGDAAGVYYELLDTRTDRVLRKFDLDPRALNEPTANAIPVTASLDGRYVYFGFAVLNKDGSDGPAYVSRWSTARGGRPTTIPLHARGMIAMRITQDGRLTVATDGEIATWNAVTLRRLHSTPTTVDRASAGAIAPDGRTLAYGLPDGTVHFVEAATGKETTGSTAHVGFVSALTFSPDSRTAVSGGNDGVAIVWNPKTGEALDRLTGHVAAIHDVAFSGDGRTLYTSSLDGTILQWDVGGHRRFGRSFGVGTWPATSFVSPPFAISRDGSRFAALAGSAAVGIYSTTSLRRTTSVSLAAGRHVTAVAWAGDELVVGDDRGGVGVYSAGGSTRLLYGLAGVRRPVVAVAAHGSTVAAVGVSPPVATLAIWSGRRLVRTLQVNGLRHAPGGDLAFSPDGTLLAAAVRNGPVLLVDPRSGRVARTIVPSPSDTAISVAFSPDGSLLATASWASIATLWDSRTGRQVGRRFLVAAGGAGSIAFDPTGRMLATTGDAVRLWSVSTQQQLGSAFPGPPTQWTRVAFTPDGRYLFAVPAGGAASRWPVQPAAWAAHACAVAGRNFTREEWSRFVGGRAYTRVCPHP